jgi:ribosomal protein S18 acetylase RimI-like enzyme
VNVASFEQLAVEPDLQGRGIGSALVDTAEDNARRAGAVEIGLDTSEQANALIAWYVGRGYRFVQFATWEVLNYRSVVLSKELRWDP